MSSKKTKVLQPGEECFEDIDELDVPTLELCDGCNEEILTGIKVEHPRYAYSLCSTCPRPTIPADCVIKPIQETVHVVNTSDIKSISYGSNTTLQGGMAVYQYYLNVSYSGDKQFNTVVDMRDIFQLLYATGQEPRTSDTFFCMKYKRAFNEKPAFGLVVGTEISYQKNLIFKVDKLPAKRKKMLTIFFDEEDEEEIMQYLQVMQKQYDSLEIGSIHK
jgi:hypothetical protein